MFRVFDFNADGEISKIDLIGGLRYLLAGANIEPNDIELMAEKIIAEVDVKHKNSIDMEGISSIPLNLPMSRLHSRNAELRSCQELFYLFLRLYVAPLSLVYFSFFMDYANFC